MGRFYNTSVPTFLDNNIYAPPFELMQAAIANKETDITNTLTQTEILKGLVDNIQHLDFEAENKRVLDIQKDLNDKVDKISKKVLNDPMSYEQLLPEIDKLKTELAQRKNAGDIYSIEKRALDFKDWTEKNKKVLEKSPDLYNQMGSFFLRDVIDRATSDVAAPFNGEQIVERPDLVLKYKDVFENIKANSIQTSDGRYKYKNEELTEEEISEIAWNTLLSDPNYSGYVNQMSSYLGDTRYNNSPYKLVDSEGNEVSFENYTKLSKADKLKIRKVLNRENPFYNDLSSVAKTYGFQNVSIDEDEYGKMSQQNKYALQQIGARSKAAENLERLRQSGQKDKLILEYQLKDEYDRNKYKSSLLEKAKNGDKKAEEDYMALVAKETVGIIKNPQVSLIDDENKTFGKNYIDMSPEDKVAHQRVLNASSYAEKEVGRDRIDLLNGASVEIKDYMNFLNGEKPTKENAETFLLRRGVGKDYNRSSFQKTLDSTDRLPDFLQTDQANVVQNLLKKADKYNKKQEEWYTNHYNNKSSQISLNPIVNPSIEKDLMTDVTNMNTDAYTFVDTETGNLVLSAEKKKEIIDKIKKEKPQLFVTAANAHAEMGLSFNFGDGNKYLAILDPKDTARATRFKRVSALGVDENSPYYRQILEEHRQTISRQLNGAGTNKKGTKSTIYTVSPQLEISIETDGQNFYIRDPFEDITSDHYASFSSLEELIHTLNRID